MKDFFEELFEYTHQTNLKFISAFEAEKNKAGQKSIMLMSHILNAQHIWISRVELKLPVHKVWDVHPIEAFREFETENYKRTLALFSNVDLTKVLDYQLSNGTSMKNEIRDMLFQVINHSTYHRAQISSEWKQNGIEPIASDYIIYKR